MYLTANHSSPTIWAIEHSSDNIWLLELLLEKWNYNTVRIKDNDVLNYKINSQTNLPDLIIISIAPLQKNGLELIAHFRQNPYFEGTPILCLCPSGCLYEFQIIAAGANDVLNRPFELEDLHRRLQGLLEKEINYQQSKQEMTLLVSDESKSLIQQQQYWAQIFEQYSESNVWQMLNQAGYEVFKQI